jgi:hypothetical protein
MGSIGVSDSFAECNKGVDFVLLVGSKPVKWYFLRSSGTCEKSPVMVFQVTSLLIRFPAAFMFFLSFASSHNTSGERGGTSQVLIASSSCRTDIPFVVSGAGMIIFPACRANITSCFFIGSLLLSTVQLQASPGSFVSSSV